MTEEQTQDTPMDQLTKEESLALEQFISQSSAVNPGIDNIHKFLSDVSVSKDTTKTGNLTIDELGLPLLPVRTVKELALFCKDIANMSYFADYFDKESEILTATSLSKEAKLLDLAVVSRRELGDVTKKSPKENKNWFGKKKKGGSEYE